MRKILSIFIGLFLISSFLFSDSGTLKANRNQAINPERATEPAWISFLEGTVNLNFERAEINMIVMSADELKTQQGRVEVYFRRNYFRLDRYTEVIFVNLEENLVLLRIKSGNVYIRTKDIVTIQTPHRQTNLSAGLYRIDVKKNKTNIYFNPKVIDDNFDRFNSRRESEINRYSQPETRYISYNSFSLYLYEYYSWRWRAFYRNIYWLSIYYGSWNPFWSPFWSLIWYSYHNYYSFFYWRHRPYYFSSFRNYYSPYYLNRVKTVIRKSQLQRKVPQKIISSRTTQKSSRVTIKSPISKISSSRIRVSSRSSYYRRPQLKSRIQIRPRIRISNSKYISRIPRSFHLAKKKIKK